jgi:hypothetical protein
MLLLLCHVMCWYNFPAIIIRLSLLMNGDDVAIYLAGHPSKVLFCTRLLNRATVSMQGMLAARSCLKT